MQHNIVGNMVLSQGDYEEENELQLFDNPNVTNPYINIRTHYYWSQYFAGLQ